MTALQIVGAVMLIVALAAWGFFMRVAQQARRDAAGSGEDR